jgi:hypothetical protein
MMRNRDSKEKNRPREKSSWLVQILGVWPLEFWDFLERWRICARRRRITNAYIIQTSAWHAQITNAKESIFSRVSLWACLQACHRIVIPSIARNLDLNL